ncbi:MAG: cupin domain-containing protein [Clostridia bacterium]|nr:cupin domain-containing protein [Clostridia bacterium]
MMIIKASNCKVDARKNMKGGDGTVYVTEFVTPKELNDKGRLFGNIHLDPGASIGYHVHEGESELFYVVRGEAVYNDNGTEYPISAGDTAIVTAGNGHAVANRGTEPVDLVALIVYA